MKCTVRHIDGLLEFIIYNKSHDAILSMDSKKS